MPGVSSGFFLPTRPIRHRTDRVAPHKELAAVLVGDREPEALVKPYRRICLHHAQRHGLAGARGFANDPTHHLGADALTPKGRLDKQLGDKQRIRRRRRLQPADVGAVAPDDADLLRVPSLAKAGNARRHFEVGPRRRLHAGKIQLRAIVEIPRRRRTESDWRCFYPHDPSPFFAGAAATGRPL